MSVNLQKGQKISLVKPGEPGLKRIMVGLGWDEVEQKRGWFAPKPSNLSVAYAMNGKSRPSRRTLTATHRVFCAARMGASSAMTSRPAASISAISCIPAAQSSIRAIT